jgi:NitT/TauT family transport system substrate-binding protein/putative hydroxymethylpyrimidine transport system substrate-binding protein
MRRVAAPLAAALIAAAVLAGCGGSGAEPGASREATLVLDFQPNAVHTGIYAALARGYYEDEGVDLTVREPSATTDAPKLLEAGRADCAILDIHDLGLARERGLDVVGVVPIVQRPLASVLARADRVMRPRDLEGKRAGVTGLPSDDAVLDSVVEADGGDAAAVDRVTIGFNAVAALAAGKVDAATGFWNAEGIALRRQGTPVREFRVDDYGAPPYPELVMVATRKLIDSDPALVDAAVRATTRGYEAALDDPGAALDDLLEANPSLDRAEQQAQLDALLPALRPPGRFDPAVLREWAAWDLEHGLLKREPRIEDAFLLDNG